MDWIYIYKLWKEQISKHVLDVIDRKTKREIKESMSIQIWLVVSELQ